MPERIRILFIGEIHSSHAVGWINLLHDRPDQFEIRAVQIGLPESKLPIHVYHVGRIGKVDQLFADDLYPADPRLRELISSSKCSLPDSRINAGRTAIIDALRDFKPHIVHTFGFDSAALVYAQVSKIARGAARWILQTRGGSDVAFHRNRTEWQELFRIILPQADYVVCDNDENYKVFADLGIIARRSEILPRVCGSGGIDLAAFGSPGPIGDRERLIVWNKAYESHWSKGLPVLEAIRIAFPRIAPVRFVFTAVQEEIEDWIRLLPEEIRASIDIRDRISHQEMLTLMRQARIVLAPSLVDGIPNTLYETMAAGAVPIVSPLETLLPHFKEGENVFYARNLYPDEIAEAIVKAFNSGDLPSIVSRNLDKVKEMADRRVIQEQVRRLYIELAERDGEEKQIHGKARSNIPLMKRACIYLRAIGQWSHERLVLFIKHRLK
jgi:glycosyltransferase involved in cell wall biosynthesis